MTNLREKILELSYTFVKNLPERIKSFEIVTRRIKNGNNSPEQSLENVNELNHLSHSLAGSAGTFGLKSLCESSSVLEAICRNIISPPRQIVTEDLNNILQQTQILIDEAKSLSLDSASVIFGVTEKTSLKLSTENQQPNILVVDDDPASLDLVNVELETLGYNVLTAASLDAFYESLEISEPSLIIMDIEFSDEDGNGIQAIRQSKDRGKISCPVIFLTMRDDFQAKLGAIRAGGDSFLVKPFGIENLGLIVNQFVENNPDDPYRAVIIDDELELAQMLSLHCNGVGLEAVAISDPEIALATISENDPDVIVMDINMPEVSGFELAMIIKADDKFSQIPIIFLTAQGGIERQKYALNIGADDFVEKSSSTDFLLSMITARAKRYRKSHSTLVKLSESERNLSAIYNSSTECIITVDQQGAIEAANPQTTRTFGYIESNLIGKNISFLLPKEERSDHEAFLVKSVLHQSHGISQTKDLVGLRQDGSVFPIELSITATYVDRQKKFINVLRDVSERKNAEEAARSAEQKFQLAIENLNTGFALWDEHDKLIMWNKQFIEFNLEVSDIVHRGMSFREFITLIAVGPTANVSPENRESYIEARIADHRSSEETTFEALRADGKWVRRIKQRLENGAAVVMVSDFTDSKLHQEELENARISADQANLAKSDFLSSMSHELRTPMNAILGFAQLLESNPKDPLSDSQIRHVQQILKGGEHLLDLIDQVLELSKIEAGKIALSIENVETVASIQRCLDMISTQAKDKGIELQFPNAGYVFPPLEPDHNRFNQILLNLLSNAIKYNRDGGKVTVTISPAKHGFLRINVTDTDLGISDNYQARIFEPFDRLGRETGEIEGTGIGLTITKQIVELLNGDIGFETEVGKGSNFWIELPIFNGENVAQIAQKDVNGQETLTETESPPGIVLYIEDNPANVQLMEGILSRLPNLILKTAHTAELGLDLARDLNPDIILMDINLPGMDGIAALNRLRMDETTRDIPVVAISAAAMPKEIERGKEAGFNEYLTKPIKVPEVLQAVNQYIRQTNSGA
jgi:PAS domain S-box-containing protein